MTYIDEKQQQHMVQDSHTKGSEAAALTNYAWANGILKDIFIGGVLQLCHCMNNHQYF